MISNNVSQTTLERALELFPSCQPEVLEVRDVQANDTSAESSNIPDLQTLLRATFNIAKLEEIRSRDLDNLWQMDNAEGSYAHWQFLENLALCPEIAIKWSKSKRHFEVITVEALRQKKIKPKRISIEENSVKLFIRKRILITPLTYLALIRLLNEDILSFTRIISVRPAEIIGELLNHETFPHACIFTERVIWATIAMCSPKLHGSGGGYSWAIAALSQAFANFLMYHKTDELIRPYSKTTEPFYAGGRFGADALANNASAFRETVECIWKNLAPQSVLEDDILQQNNDVTAKRDNYLGALLVNIVYAGIRIHLQAVIKRQTKQRKKISMTIGRIASLLKSVTSIAPMGGEIVKETVAPVSDVLARSAERRIASINKNSDPSELLEHFQGLYKSIAGDNSTSGRFVVSQRVMLNNELRALVTPGRQQPAREQGEEEMLPDAQRWRASPDVLHRALRRRVQGSSPNRTEEETSACLRRILEARIKRGQDFRTQIIALTNHNRHSMPV